MKALIFGISGQDGIYLKTLLKNKGFEVIGVSRSTGDWLVGDVSNLSFVSDLIQKNMPDYIFHLAANSTTKHDSLFENHETISTGSLNILESVYKFSPSSRVFLSGSGLQFVNKGIPICESDSFVATSPYSVSRIQSVYAARYYRALGLKVFVGYFFNHDSPYRSEKHVNQMIVQAVKRIAAGSNEKLSLHDPTIKKEFSFAGDVAMAILTLIENDQIFEAVIGSGKAYSIEDWVRICFGYYDLSFENRVVKGTPLKREYDVLVSDPETIFSLGWRPKVDIHGLAKLMIEN